MFTPGRPVRWTTYTEKKLTSHDLSFISLNFEYDYFSRNHDLSVFNRAQILIFYIDNGNVVLHSQKKWKLLLSSVKRISEVFFTGLDNDGVFCPFKISVDKRVSEVCIFCFRKQPDRVTRVSFSSSIAVQGIPVLGKWKKFRKAKLYCLTSIHDDQGYQ